MNFARFFVDRPIFAGVISLLTVIAGAICLPLLPISEYPEIVPPSVVVSAQFPGASPEVISETVASPLEEQINGVENMLYMSSRASADGSMGLTVTFKIGTDPDLAQQLVQNRVSQALPRLPDVVRLLGVTTVKSSPDLTMVVHLYSPNNRYDTLYLRNFANLTVKDELARIQGVGQVRIFGSGDYAMRLWLDPQKIAARDLTAADVVNAVREQNVQAAAGSVGKPPNDGTVGTELLIRAQGRLTTPEEFGDIIIRASADGDIVRLKDVARVEMGGSQYAVRSLLDGKPAVGVPVFQAPESNALEIAENVYTTMQRLKKTFPEDIDYKIAYDPTVFVRKSIDAVETTLLEAVGLVVLVVIVFLQTWRASIVPLLAVPVSIIGTFVFMYLFGFSINTLSLFGMVLAIGIVVDDAIVVVENVERNIESGLSPREATYKAMKEVTGPIIATALVLSAVFIPIAFISGLTGQFYKQFALTIAISTFISTINSLTLSPALSALLLKPHGAKKDVLERGIDAVFGRFFALFNRFFNTCSDFYANMLEKLMRIKAVPIAIYIALIGVAFALFYTVPTGYVPDQDKQYLVAFAQLPSGASLERTDKVMQRMSDILLKNPGVKNAIAFPGLSIAGFSAASNEGIVFAGLKDFKDRTSPELSGKNIAQTLNAEFASIQDAYIAIFPPPPVSGLSTIGGFKLQIQDKSDQGYEGLNKALQAVQQKAWQTKELSGVFSTFQINNPQLVADVDRTKAKQLGVPINDIFNTMQIYLGSLYINDFNNFGRTYQVIAQADAPFRDSTEDIKLLKTRNASGEMVPLGSFMEIKESYGPTRTERYNAFASVELNGAPSPGYSSGQAQRAIEKVLDESLPKGFSYQWTELTYQQILAGNTAIYVFPLCIFLVFLVLAAQYESFSLPIAILLIVPMSLLCAIFGVWLVRGDNNIFTQIALIVLVGLASKNAILIVEFARELEQEGLSTVHAAIKASRLRLRPILMTSFAFILGVLPLVLAKGEGAEMRNAMGIAVFSGMLGVTFFGLILTPIFYVVVRQFAGTTHETDHPPEEHHPYGA